MTALQLTREIHEALEWTQVPDTDPPGSIYSINEPLHTHIIVMLNLDPQLATSVCRLQSFTAAAVADQRDITVR